jgi:hypothetical protein
MTSTTASTRLSSPRWPLSDRDDPQAPRFYVRALYDFDSADPSCISFRADDVLEILGSQTGTLDTDGWWDGLLGQERGWIPANHVERIPDPAPAPAPDARRRPSVDTTVATSAAARQPASARAEDHARASDYWLPQVDAASGQVSYRNARTGERAAALPQDSSPVYDGSWAALDLSQAHGPASAHPSAYADLSEAYGMPLPSSAGSERPASVLPRAGTGTRTPPSWVRRVASDGVTTYYEHRADGRVAWARPSPSSSPVPDEDDNPRTAVPPSASASVLTPLASSGAFLPRPDSGALGPKGGAPRPSGGALSPLTPAEDSPLPHYTDQGYGYGYEYATLSADSTFAASFPLPPSGPASTDTSVGTRSSEKRRPASGSASGSGLGSFSGRRLPQLVAVNPDASAPTPAHSSSYASLAASASAAPPLTFTSSSSSFSGTWPPSAADAKLAAVNARTAGPSAYLHIDDNVNVNMNDMGDDDDDDEGAGPLSLPEPLPPPAYHCASDQDPASCPVRELALLQRPPTPPAPAPPSLDALLARATDALGAVAALFDDPPPPASNDSDDPPPYDASVPAALGALSAALRELFYTTALPLAEIPPALTPTTPTHPHHHHPSSHRPTSSSSSLSPAHARSHSRSHSQAQAQAPGGAVGLSRARINDLRLRPAQRRVTSALSKLVLVAPGRDDGRLRTYAAEVGAALDAFVAEVRAQQQQAQAQQNQGQGQGQGQGEPQEFEFARRLRGAFGGSSSASASQAPGGPRELDWLAPLDEGDATRRALDGEVLNELKARAGGLCDHLDAFERDIDAADLPGACAALPFIALVTDHRC